MMGLSLFFVACSNENGGDDITPEIPKPEIIGENLIICNEGNWQSDNGQLSYYDGTAGVLTNKWFRQVNGSKLGDTPNDIIQYIHPDGTACGATENVPNNRRMCADGNYLYITSYAHQCGNQTFEKGYVAKIDVKTKQGVATCEVGWEPEGVRLYEGKLYVANTGGYAFSENHAYETTVQVVDAETMKSIKTINTGCINLYGEMSQAGQYLCINSCGDYHNVKPKTVIVDCKTDEVKTFDFPATYNTTDGNLFYTIGSAFSYITNEYTYYIKTINPKTREVADGIFCNAITQKIKEITSPYELYISPYTKNVYFTDAGSYGSAGYLYGYTNEGQPVFAPQKTYVNPAHILALPVYENK